MSTQNIPPVKSGEGGKVTPSSNAGAQTTAADPATKSETFEPLHIISLKPKLAPKMYQQHMQRVAQFCQGEKSAIDGKPAAITNIHRYPFTGDTVEMFCYIGRFNDAIIKKIKDTFADQLKAVEVNRESPLCALSHDFAPERRTATWQLAALSQPAGKFKTDGIQQRYLWRGVDKLGEGSTIYILDTGLHVDALEKLEQDGPDFERSRIKFYDAFVAKSLAERTLGELQTVQHVTDKSVSNAFQDVLLESSREAYWSNHMPWDDSSLHGTTVAALAASTIRGSAPLANVVVFRVGGTAPSAKQWVPSKDATVSTELLLFALFRIMNSPVGDVTRSVINCSFQQSEDFQVLKDGFAILQEKGMHVVTGTGNSSNPLTGKGTGFDISLRNVYPACYPKIFCVGSLDINDTRVLSSNWANPHTNDIHIVYTYGHNVDRWFPSSYIDGFGGKPAADKKPNGGKVSGVSFAAPIVSGILASLLGAKEGKEKVSHKDLWNDLLLFTDIPKVTDSDAGYFHLLTWGSGWSRIEVQKREEEKLKKAGR